MSLVRLIENLVTDWGEILIDEELERISKIHENQKDMYEPHLEIFPPDNLIFNCFNFFNIRDTKVVILGQDPYINRGEAQGLCFSVPNGVKTPPSLLNIFKELEAIYGNRRIKTDLRDWAEQGVLLLNTALTVLEGKSNINAKLWVKYTDKIISEISKRCEGVVFILWGNNAIGKSEFIDEKKHMILKSVHPSPLSASRGFFGNNHFGKTNDYLNGLGKKKIEWI
jgi:uracil-DNA glycosylase